MQQDSPKVLTLQITPGQCEDRPSEKPHQQIAVSANLFLQRRRQYPSSCWHPRSRRCRQISPLSPRCCRLRPKANPTSRHPRLYSARHAAAGGRGEGSVGGTPCVRARVCAVCRVCRARVCLGWRSGMCVRCVAHRRSAVLLHLVEVEALGAWVWV